MYPAIWGSEFWSVIHLVAFTYPEVPSKKKKKSVQLLFENLCPNLPCAGCSIHCIQYLSENPPKLSCRSDLIDWTIDFHNNVNKRTGKRVLDKKEAYQKIEEKFFTYDDWVETKKHQLIRIEDHKDIDKWKNLALSKTSKKTNNSFYFVLVLTCIIIILIFVALSKTSDYPLHEKQD